MGKEVNLVVLTICSKNPFYLQQRFADVKRQEMKVDAVLFDLFNTLVLIENDDAYYVPSIRKLHEFLAEKGVKIPLADFLETYLKVRDKLYEDSAESLEEPHFNVRVSRTLEKFGYTFKPSHPIVKGATQAFSEVFVKYVHPDSDAIYVLRKLQGKYKLGLISNLSISESASEILQRFGLTPFFDVILISGAINKRKPSREIFERALKALHVTADKTLFVGDTPQLDIDGPKSVGIKAVLIQRKSSPSQPAKSPPLYYKLPDSKTKIQPDATISSLKELLDLLKDC
jgi:putative hydrolase of the HAD superfamily